MVSSPRELAALLGGSPLVIMLDIDGTLCDIVEKPGDACVPPHASNVLRELNKLVDKDVHVALVTGRSVADARRMIGFDGVVIYGNHGSERASRSGTVRAPDGWKAVEQVVSTAAAAIADVTRDFPGARLEDKRYSLSLHYRDIAMSREAELHERVAEATRDMGVVVANGKCVLNVTPQGVPDKGDAALEVLASVAGGGTANSSVLFAGDDVTDEDAFVALRQLPDAVTVRVGESARPTAARFSLRSPSEVHRLLDMLLAARA